MGKFMFNWVLGSMGSKFSLQGANRGSTVNQPNIPSMNNCIKLSLEDPLSPYQSFLHYLAVTSAHLK